MASRRARGVVTGVVGAVIALAGGGCGSAANPSPAASDPPDARIEGSVWVANESGNSLSVIDAATNAVVTTIEGIEGPHNVQVGPDGNRVYASSGHTSTVLALDAATYRLAHAAPTGAGPSHVVLSADGQKTYVTNYDDGTVSVYGGELAPSGTISVGDGPHGMRPTPDGAMLVVANLKAATVDLIDTRGNTKIAAVPVNGPVVQVAVSPDSQYAFASVTQPPSVVKIDLRARAVVGRTDVSAAPAQVYISPDGRSLLSADQGSKDKPGTAVSLIDTATMTTAGTIKTGSGPHGVVIDPTGRRAWVSNVYDSTVSVIDLSSRSTTATIKVGTGPNGISYGSRPPAPAAATVSVVLPSPSASSSHTDHGGHG